MSKLAVIQIKGIIGSSQYIKDVLKHLKIKKNNCRIIEDSPNIRGMIQKVNHLVTWGVVDDETLKLLANRGEGPVYALHPPVKGFGRKGIKVAFTRGGAFGNRGEKINDLIKRML